MPTYEPVILVKCVTYGGGLNLFKGGETQSYMKKFEGHMKLSENLYEITLGVMNLGEAI